MSIDDTKATMGTDPTPKDDPILMSLRNAHVIAMFRYVAHLARELHREARIVGPSCEATQAMAEIHSAERAISRTKSKQTWDPQRID